METFKKFDSNGNPIEEEDMFMLFSPSGVLYYGNIATGRIKWLHDTKKTSYQAMQWVDDEPHADVGEDGNTLHLYSPDSESSKLISFDSEADLQHELRETFKKDFKASYKEYDLYLTQDRGEKRSEGGDNVFKIVMMDCRCGIDDSWHVRYLNAKILSPCACAGEGYLELVKVFHARTDQKFIELCDEFSVRTLPGEGILARTINDKYKIRIHERIEIAAEDQICYFNGTIGTLKVFVKRIPIGRGDLKKKIDDAYTDFDRLEVEAVVKLLLVESDKNFVYFAYEKFDYSLATFIKTKSDIPEDSRISILRGITTALQELHSHCIFHGNLCPEHILLKCGHGVYAGGVDVIIKFCGVGLSECLSKLLFEDKKKHNAEKHALGRTVLNLWTDGQYCFKQGDYTYDFSPPQFLGYDLDTLDSVPQDLIRKLVCPSSTKVEEVINHVIFWNKEDTVHFLECLSHRISSGGFDDIESVSHMVFTDNWILADSSDFKVWFLGMIRADQVHRIHRFCKPATECWNDFQDEFIESVYDTTKLRGLLKICRNTAIHPRLFYPARDKVELLGFISKNYPDLVMVLYNHLSTTHSLKLAELFK